MSDLPTGTVTFLFTDIEGSTKLAQQHPAAWEAARARHHAILREACEAQHGHVFQIVGDAFCVAFATAAAGLQAAIAAQHALQAEPWGKTPIRVRMGLHTGAAEAAGSEYTGYLTLAHVQRVMSTAYGGQTLLSNAASALLASQLPETVTLRDMGEHRLKGLLNPERLWQVEVPGLPRDFPPLHTLNAIPNNLPSQVTSFIGREHELADAKRLLDGTRLLTLTGSGGTGKTRLSLQIAADVLDAFAHGVWLVELAPLASPELVMQAVAAALGVREQPERAVIDTLADHLRAKSLLLILDNCEHLIEACAQLSAALLRACPRLKILASSREALGVAGETAYRVPSLGLPSARDLTLDRLMASESARLFIERAQSAQSRFAPSEHNAGAIAQICRRLDGIPLALELAAARVKLFSAEQIAARLDDRFRLLTGGSRTAVPRQQTLRALIDWSYELLGEAERAALRALSVFAGGWTFEAAEAVCGGDTLELLAHLADKSLVVVADQPAAPRYHLLETIRQYAREKLLEAHEGPAARDRHLAHFAAIAEEATPLLLGRDMIVIGERLESDLDNLRAALEWGLETAPLAALRIAGSVWMLFGLQAGPREGLRWLQAALARSAAQTQGNADRDSLLTRAMALAGASLLAYGIGENHEARAMAGESIDLARRIRAPDVLARALGHGSLACGMLGDVAAARAWAEEGLAISRQHDLLYEQSTTLGALIMIGVFTADPLPDSLLDDYERVTRAAGNPMGLATAAANLGRVATMRGNLTEAYRRFEESAQLFRHSHNPFLVNANHSEQAHILRMLGRLPEALAMYRVTIYAWREIGHRAAIARELECMAFIAIALDDPLRAARIAGAAESLREASGSLMIRHERAEYEANLSVLRQQLAPDAFKTAWSAGRAMPIDDAIAYAAEERDAQPA